jgi:glycosyltransferase involved in cell wall biosynthesis
MAPRGDSIRVLQSFPHKIGAGRICQTAWHQAVGVARGGGDVLVKPLAVHKHLPPPIRVEPTLARGRWRVPERTLGRIRASKLHDRLVARALPGLVDRIDLVHTWPLGALETLRTARRLGIPTVLERPNAHTRFAYEVVRDECRRLGVTLPSNHEHAYNDAILQREEQEYGLADALLCPSEFVVRTFLDQGVAREKLARHTYGYDEGTFYPAPAATRNGRRLTVLFVGVCAVRKGLHFALEAWLNSPASSTGSFLIAGEFLPSYEHRLADALAHPSVHRLGHRTDVPSLMRTSDALVLPSIEEGFGLVCVEALASGTIPLVSDACTEACVDGQNALVHRVGDSRALTRHLTSLSTDERLLRRLRAGCLRTAPDHTWTAAGARLLRVYGEVVAAVRERAREDAPAAA